jgi:Tfp pilus assembly protein PilX
MSDVEIAWQGALEAELQAVYGYELLGPRLSGADRDHAVACQSAHEALRDATSAALTAAGYPLAPPAADYPSLYPVPGASAAPSLAVRLEDDCAAAWRYLYLAAASTNGHRVATLRTTAQQRLTDSALRAMKWRLRVTPKHPTVPFPGI